VELELLDHLAGMVELAVELVLETAETVVLVLKERIVVLEAEALVEMLTDCTF
jgi:hypothetical protein